MVQLFDLTGGRREKESSLRNFGQSMFKMGAENINQMLNQNYQRGRLQEAFNKLKGQNPENFLETLSAIAPDLLSTPGGAQALGELSPILSAYSQNSATKKAIQNRRAQEGNQPQQTTAEVPQKTITETDQEKTPPPSRKGFFRQPVPPVSEETTFPDVTAGPQTVKLMSPQEIENYALDIQDQSLQTGKPIPFAEALNLAQQQNTQRAQFNQQIQSEKNTREEALQKRSENLVNRARNSGLIKSDFPESETVIQKLAMDANRSKNETDAWEYVRTGARDFENARNEILRKSDISGPVTNFYRKMLGNYKDFETISKELQRPLDKLRKYGLFDEARDLLVNELGMGPEQAESTLFPMTKEEKNDLEKFSKNKPTMTQGVFDTYQDPFPGEEANLSDKEFGTFKDSISQYLSKYPDANLISMRGLLNQSKGYSWRDISRAVDELIQEDRFTPDIEQNKELSVIREAPIEGLTQIFKNLWTGAK